jgi:hypothetical protein
LNFNYPSYRKIVAVGCQQRASGLVVKTICCVMYLSSSGPTKVIFENG